MFYDIFIKLCEKNNVKPTPLLKFLKLSPGNLEKWKNGSTINSEILCKLSEYFQISIDYLLTGKDPPSKDLNVDQLEWLGLYDKLSPEKRLEFKGELKGYIKAEEENKR